MKLVVRNTDEADREVGVCVRKEGKSVVCVVNGHILLWINDSGTIHRNTMRGNEFAEMGFRIDSTGAVEDE